MNLRKEPNLESVILDTFAQGTAITILGEEGDWYRVAAGAKEGYMMKALVASGGKPSL
ncbi:MAG: SH3 domain-containing protein [Smithella sp.]|nr:SH3 domain-containing protein [Syntrophaceae bacterium]MBP9650459.1 SH3 domain-containing protein [Syntrophaceae bacterium]NMC91569.1 SH3 domain-containing protein [Smithella sp.]HQP06883.1 SH3 domain-containing protein [Smithellaceae bacterium]